MTLCVAGFCDNGKTLIVASDYMVSFGEVMTHSPGLVKGYAFNYSWFGTFAGLVTPFEPIMNRFLKRIEHEANSFATITTAFEDAYRAERTATISARVTGKYALTLEQFLRVGKRQLSKSRYEKLAAEIEQFDLGTAFLVGGMDEQGAHHLFGVFDPGHAEHFTGHGFAAIGIGSEDALKMFTFRGYNWGSFSRLESVHAVVEAKIFGEGPFVGKETLVIIIDYAGQRVTKWHIPIASPLRRSIRQGRRSEAESLLQAELDRPDAWQPLTTL
jgi:20S proteasome alpha/beta subunit